MGLLVEPEESTAGLAAASEEVSVVVEAVEAVEAVEEAPTAEGLPAVAVVLAEQGESAGASIEGSQAEAESQGKPEESTAVQAAAAAA